jgi:nucleotide-binding universal stress UspA family protein
MTEVAPNEQAAGDLGSEPEAAVIVAAVDTSGTASRVIEAATRLARRNWHGAQLNIVHVFKTGLFDRPPPGGGHGADLTSEARQYLDHHVRMAKRQCSAPVTGHFAIGDPVDEIVRLADSVSADVILIGVHDASGLERLLLGSVAENIVRRARCSVFVVRQKERAPKRA